MKYLVWQQGKPESVQCIEARSVADAAQKWMDYKPNSLSGDSVVLFAVCNEPGTAPQFARLECRRKWGYECGEWIKIEGAK